VDVVQIDFINAKALQRGGAGLLYPSGVATDTTTAFASAGFVGVPELCAKEDFGAAAGFFEPATEESFVGFGTVDVGCVPECDARGVVSGDGEMSS